MYNSFGDYRYEKSERIADLIAFITDFLTRHPWFEMIGEVHRFEQPKTFYQLSCYEESDNYKIDAVIYVKPTRPAPAQAGVHAFLLGASNGVKCYFARLPDAQANHVHDARYLDVAFAHPQYYLIRACFSLYDPILNVERTSRNYKETKSNYQKALDKAFDRFGPSVRREPKLSQPEFYPIGTVVKFCRSIGSDLPDVQTVLAVTSNSPGSYLLRLDQRYKSNTFKHDPQVSINVSHVERIVKRGEGRVFGGDEVLQTYMSGLHRSSQMYDGELVSVQVYRRAETDVMKAVESMTDSHWLTHNPVQFVTHYIEVFCDYSMDFYCQFDAHRFLAHVTEFNATWYEPYRINKKRFRRQLRRLHCFLNKKKIAVEEDRIEDMRYCEEIT